MNVLYLCADDRTKALHPPIFADVVTMLAGIGQHESTSYFVGPRITAPGPHECTFSFGKKDAPFPQTCGFPTGFFHAIVSEFCPVVLFEEESTLKDLYAAAAPECVLILLSQSSDMVSSSFSKKVTAITSPAPYGNMGLYFEYVADTVSLVEDYLVQLSVYNKV